MKLVDILASELEGWPVEHGVEFVTQDNTGHVYGWKGCRPICIHGEWIWNDDQKDFTPWRPGNMAMSEDRKEAIVTREQWEAAVDALNAGEPTWPQEGALPPVGIKVEIRNVRGYAVRADSECFIGRKVRVAAVFKATDWGLDMIAVDGGFELGCEVFRADMAYPAVAVLTAEQIAANERSEAINKMVDCCSQPTWVTSYENCAALYDAGYRKQAAQ